MGTKYFRITAYLPKHDISFIADSNGKFEKLWQFSAYLMSKGCEILEVSNDENFIDINIDKATEDTEHFLLRACQQGKPTYSQQTIDNISHKTVSIENKHYIP